MAVDGKDTKVLGDTSSVLETQKTSENSLMDVPKSTTEDAHANVNDTDNGNNNNNEIDSLISASDKDALMNTVPKKRKAGQMTFDDFKTVKVVNDANHNTNPNLRRSTRIRVADEKKVVEQLKGAEDSEKDTIPKKVRKNPKKKIVKKSKEEPFRPRIKVKMTLKDEDKEQNNLDPEKSPTSEAKKRNASEPKKKSTSQPKKKNTPAKKPDTTPRSGISKDLMNLKKTLTRINERDLYTKDWLPAIPLPTEQLENTDNDQLVHEWKKYFADFLKPIPYAGLIVKIMTFLKKFSHLLDNDLITLSFQDFEIGLNLSNNANLDKNTEQDLSKIKFYQDLMNYFFFYLLRLLFDKNKKTSFEHFMSLGNPLKIYVIHLRKVAFEWGIPKEWRHLDVIPIFTTSLDKTGLSCLAPIDRLIMLSTLVSYILSQSSIVHEEIHTINHDKKDLGIENDSYYVTRYLLQGKNNTLKDFDALCEQIQFHLDRKRINMIKKKRIMKDSFKIQCQNLREVKEALRDVEPNDKNDVLMSLYDKFVVLFEGFILDNPLGNPYDDELYTLRLQDFFIGRLNNIGDFYLPWLSTKETPKKVNIFTSLINLLKIFDKYKKGDVNRSALYRKFNETISKHFKLLFHDKTTMMSLVLNDKDIDKDGAHLWFEISSDSKSLQSFIIKLDELLANCINDANETDDILSSLIMKDKNNHLMTSIMSLKEYLKGIQSLFEQIELALNEFGNTGAPSRRINSTKSNYADKYEEEEKEDNDTEIYDESIEYSEEEIPEQYAQEKEDEDYSNEVYSDIEEDEYTNRKEEKKVKDDLTMYSGVQPEKQTNDTNRRSLRKRT